MAGWGVMSKRGTVRIGKARSEMGGIERDGDTVRDVRHSQKCRGLVKNGEARQEMKSKSEMREPSEMRVEKSQMEGQC